MHRLRSIVVEHATENPAIDCMYAAQLAAALAHGGEHNVPSFVRLRGEATEPGFSDMSQHVSSWGAVVPTGLLWVDRIAEGTLTPERDRPIEACGNSAFEVLSINPHAFPGWEPRQVQAAV